MLNVPNITISVSEELRAEMDKLSEVNWSDICRKAISQYIAQRKNPNPRIELELRDARLTHKSFETGYPTLSLTIKVFNRTDSEIIVDRILCKARFRNYDTHYAIGIANDLNRRGIGHNMTGHSSIHLVLSKEKIQQLKDVFDSTFYCDVSCIVYVDGFKNPHHQEIKTRIPIDDWRNVVEKVLNPKQTTSM